MKSWWMGLMMLAGTTISGAMAWAGDDSNVMPATAAQIRASIAGLPIDAIRPTVIDGLYELKVGGQIFYSDRTGKYLISNGHIFDTATRKDLTAARLEAINTVDWSMLPLEKAIVSGDPKGMPVAVFTDPHCPYCKKLEANLKDAKGIKFYTFLFPLERIHPTARADADAIWCAKDQHAALVSVMLDGQKVVSGTCKTPTDDVIALAQKLNIGGTPTMIASDGRRYAGVKTASELQAWLAEK